MVTKYDETSLNTARLYHQCVTLIETDTHVILKLSS